MADISIDRRRLLAGGAGLCSLSALGISPLTLAAAEKIGPSLGVIAKSPRFLVNGVAESAERKLFLSLPRWYGMDDTPSVASVEADGSLAPFPGGDWNHGDRQANPDETLIMINALHIFADDLLWVVDQGHEAQGNGRREGQKLLAFDTHNGRLVHRLAFDESILPGKAAMNDLRIDGTKIYITDSGLGAIIIHDLASGETRRRLSGHSSLRKDPARDQRATGGRVMMDGRGNKPVVHADQLEVTADGQWFYWSTPSGPLYRMPTDLLWDDAVSESARAESIEKVLEVPPIGGTAIDTLGNIYLSDCAKRCISVLTPDGEILPLAYHAALNSPDAIYIDSERRLFVPAPQNEDLPKHHGGKDVTQPPFLVFAMQLPQSLKGYPLGDAVFSPRLVPLS